MALLKSRFGGGPVPLKGCGQRAYVSAVCERNHSRNVLASTRSLSGRKGRFWESGRNKMKGQSDQTSQSLGYPYTPVFLVSNSAI